jgi:hypothetical protein
VTTLKTLLCSMVKLTTILCSTPVRLIKYE